MSETSISLLGRIKNGEQDSWKRLEFLYAPLVKKWCSQSQIPSSDVEDLSQDIFQSIFRQIQSFTRVAKYSFRGWLKKITLNRCRDFHRQAPRIPNPSELVDSITVSYRKIDEASFADAGQTPAEINEEKNVLLGQVFRLIRSEFSERDVNVFCDLVGHDVAVDAVAHLYGITKNTVYKIKCKILARIKQEFKDLIDLGT